MKKILLFVDYFIPGFKAGGPVSSIVNLVKLLNNDFEIVIAARNHDFGESETYKEVMHDEIVNYKDYKVFYMSEPNKEKILNLIEEFNPDMIFLNSFFSYFSRVVLLLSIGKVFNIKVVLAPRGELQKNALAIKKYKKNIYLFLFIFFRLHKKVEFFSTDKIETIAINQTFKKEPMATLPNVPSFIKSFDITKNGNDLKIIFLSRIRDNKNLHFALNLLNKIDDKNIVFDIYGPKEDAVYWKMCEKLIKNFRQSVKVNYKGVVAPDEIPNILGMYHVLLLPTKTENFGHVIVEAMSVGLVPIISDQTPWVELERCNAGWDIPLDNPDMYVDVIEKLYAMDNEQFQLLSKGSLKYIREKLEVGELKAKYVKFFGKVVNE